MKNIYNTIIFDFDYTLADSSKGVIECVDYALTSLGLPTVSQQEVCNTIGLSLKDTFLKLMKEEYLAKCEEFAYLFIKRADEIMADLTILYDTVPETIQSLKDDGYTLGIVSTKFRRRIKSILKRYNLLNVFDVVIGGEDVLNHKPHPEGLLLAIKQLGRSSGNTVYVGDSTIDAKTAELAKVSFIAVLSGVTPDNDFQKYNVHKIIKDISELPRILRN
jgi:phosphoglycolate phosphatase